MQSITTSIETNLVSIIIPTYNSAQFVVEAIESILRQTVARTEIIVVDDGSTDNTRSVLHPFSDQLRYIYQENQGPAVARNKGIQAAQGEYVGFLDADDIWLPEKLEVQLQFMKMHPELGLLTSDHADFEGERTLTESFLAGKFYYSDLASQVPIRHAYRKLLIENFVSTPTVLVRRECFATAGLFDETLPPVEDRDMWLRIAARFPIGCLPVVVCRKRSHGSNISRNVEKTLRARITIWEKKSQEFPELAPARVLHALLADAHLHFGYHLMDNAQPREARKAGIKSLSYALRRLFGLSRTNDPLPSYRWFLGLILIPLTFFRRSIFHSLLRAKRRIVQSLC